MTKQEFLSGQPFRIEDGKNIFRYSEKDVGELYQLINHEWRFASVVKEINFEKGLIRTTGINTGKSGITVIMFSKMIKVINKINQP